MTRLEARYRLSLGWGLTLRNTDAVELSASAVVGDCQLTAPTAGSPGESLVGDIHAHIPFFVYKQSVSLFGEA